MTHRPLVGGTGHAPASSGSAPAQRQEGGGGKSQVLAWHDKAWEFRQPLSKHSNPAGTACSPCRASLEKQDMPGWQNRVEGARATNAPAVCTVLGQQHHAHLGARKGLEEPCSMHNQWGMTPVWPLPMSPASFVTPLPSCFCVVQLSTASHIHYAVSHLCAFACVCFSLECPSHLPSFRSLLILQDHLQPSPSLGRLPQAFI